MNKLFLPLLMSVMVLGLSLNTTAGDRERYLEPVTPEVTKKPVTKTNNFRLAKDYGNIPIHFIQNQGQVNERALFYARTHGYTLWVTKDGLVFDTVKSRKTGKENRNDIEVEDINRKPKAVIRDVSSLFFPGSQKDLEIVPANISEHKVNYLIGDDPSKWHPNISTSKVILYKNIYPNIDLKVYGIERQIEYDWVIKPGGDPGKIRFQYKDVKDSRIDQQGNLLIETRFGQLMHRKPVSYQNIAGQTVPVEAVFKKVSKNTYGFRVKQYDPHHTLIIDPQVLIYSTYLGGSGDEPVGSMAVDKLGDVIVVGCTESADFPLQNPIQAASRSTRDCFILKINSDGSDIIFSTYLGGSANEWANDITLDSDGEIYITGRTESYDFPTKNALQPTKAADMDVFVTKMDSTGSRLIFSTFLGGTYYDSGKGIAVDDDRAVYVTGLAWINFPLKNPIQGYHGGGGDAFLTKINPSGTAIVYSTYLGGGSYDTGHKLVLDSEDSVFLCGMTKSRNFPTKNAIRPSFGGGNRDGYVAKINPAGSTLVYSTYLGGSDQDEIVRSALDNSNRIYVSGYTHSTDFPVFNPLQEHLRGNSDGFLTVIQNDGTGYLFSTYLGGSGNDRIYGIVLDDHDEVYITGQTDSFDFPVRSSFQANNAGANDAFIARLNLSDRKFIFSTYIGGSRDDWGRVVALDHADAVYVVGYTESSNFPTRKPIQAGNAGSSDIFITKLIADDPPTVKITSPEDNAAVSGAVDIQVEAEDDVGIENVNFTIDGQLKHTDHDAPYQYDCPTHTYTNGLHKIKVNAADTSGQQADDEITVQVQNLVLFLQVSRHEDQAWIIKKEHARIDIAVKNPGDIYVDKYEVYRKESEGEYKTIKEIKSVEFQGSMHTCYDLNLEKHKKYTYRVIAFNEDGEIIGISSDNENSKAVSAKSREIFTSIH
jgi:hypothetical protein